MIDPSLIIVDRYLMRKYLNYSSMSWVFENQDKLLNTKIDEILAKGYIPKAFKHKAWKKCILELDKINSMDTYWEMINCFISFQEAIYKAFDISLDKYEIAADDKLQMFNFLFVKSQIKQLHSRYLVRFLILCYSNFLNIQCIQNVNNHI